MSDDNLEMIDCREFEENIKHAPCKDRKCESSEVKVDKKDKKCESSEVKAIKVDESDGLSRHLNFREGMLSQVDYCHFLEYKVQLIEMSDLEESIQKCEDTKTALINNKKKEKEKEGLKGKQSKVTGQEKKDFTKEAWSPVINEFKNKWLGSIAIIERLLRRHKYIIDPEYILLIVCKDKTEVQMLDELKSRLTGMISKVDVCNTKDVKYYLLPKTQPK
jgi:hypothetical protein